MMKYPARTRSAASSGSSSPGKQGLSPKGGDNRTFGGKGGPTTKGTTTRGSANRKRNSGTKNSAEGY